MVAIVTGGSRGLGRAIAKEFAAEGAKVVVSARRASPTGLPGTAAETAHQIRAAGGEAMGLRCDVSNEEQVMAMAGQTIDLYGQVDVLVNNAGMMVLGKTLLEIQPAEWNQSVAADLRGPCLACRAVLPAGWSQGRSSAGPGGFSGRATAISFSARSGCRTRPRRTGCGRWGRSGLWGSPAELGRAFPRGLVCPATP